MVAQISSSIGNSTLPDIGTLSYNGVTFSNLYTSSISGTAVQDAAERTVKYMEYTITIDGTVTLGSADQTTDRLWVALRQLLTADGGVLTYSGKGFGNPLVINQPGGNLRDVNWGPKPKLLEFIPLGASRSAKIRWTVTTCIPEFGSVTRLGKQVLQFNQESSIGYDEDGYSTLTIKGTLEIPLTRTTQASHITTTTVDAFRQGYLTRISSSFDLTRFKVADRSFNVSRDARTMEWSFVLRELAPMGNPAGMMTARGSFTVRPEKTGATIVRWISTLKGTYTVPKGTPRRLAFIAFDSMWSYRMRQSQISHTNANGVLTASPNVNNTIAPQPGYAAAIINLLGINAPVPPPPANSVPFNLFRSAAIPRSFSVDEGLYEDSRTISFEASWILTSELRLLLQASGIWRSSGIEGGNLWSISVANISGWKSWLQNSVDPASLAIVDFGS